MSERIMVAEDDPGLRMLLETLLEEQGFDVQTVPNGDALVRATREQLPDLLLVDIMMPEMDGLEAIRQLRLDTRTAHLPMLLLTALNNPDFAVRGFDSGADDYITKPFDNDVLVARIRANLRRAARASVNNPLTGLPGNQLINAEVDHRLQQHEAFALLYVDMNNFKAFNDAYGFARGDRVIRILAQLMVELRERHSDDDLFIGHIGGDDFVMIVPAAAAAAFAEELMAAFDDEVVSLYDEPDRTRGYLVGVDRWGTPRRFPIIGIAVGIVDTCRRAYSSFADLAGVAAEVKSRAKKQPHSSYAFDERNKHPHNRMATEERRGQSPLIAITVSTTDVQARWLKWSGTNGFRNLVYPALPTLEDLDADVPGLLLVDLRLPEAWLWLETMQQQNILVPIVALAPDPSEQPRALAMGAATCITVQTRPEVVSETLLHLLRLP
ncbi:MAG: response regulator [Herpetosiphon sp.]